MDRFLLCFILTERCIKIALAQKTDRSFLPLTRFYSWPVRDAWEDMRISIKSEKWITSSESTSLLNQFTEVINYWQEGDPKIKRDVNNLRERFSDPKYSNLIFMGIKKSKR